jgi:hypothetical protein
VINREPIERVRLFSTVVHKLDYCSQREDEMGARRVILRTPAATLLASSGEDLAPQDFAAPESVKKVNLATQSGADNAAPHGC